MARDGVSFRSVESRQRHNGISSVKSGIVTFSLFLRMGRIATRGSSGVS
jgi:hypothetical protein